MEILKYLFEKSDFLSKKEGIILINRQTSFY